ncbi:hypothetical protein ACLOJK_005512 [Asimina triloba]
MARRYGILQKKVEELESEVGNLLLLRNIQLDDDFDKAIKGKFIFARRLLSAEMQMVPPQHLHHIESRLSALEAAFLSWLRSSRSSDGVAVYASLACSCNCCSNADEEAEMGDDFGSLLDVSREEEDFFLGNRVEVDDEYGLETFSCKDFEEATLGAGAAAQEEEAMIIGEARAKKEDEKRCWSTGRKSLMCVLVFGVLLGVGVATAAVRFSGEGHSQVGEHAPVKPMSSSRSNGRLQRAMEKGSSDRLHVTYRMVKTKVYSSLDQKAR